MNSMIETAAKAKAAASALAELTAKEKNEALEAMADALLRDTPDIVAANGLDMASGREKGTPEPMLDRLMLNASRVADMAEGVRQVASLPDPVGEVLEEWDMYNGVHIRKVRVPMGVIGMIYEARPNVTADAAALCFKAGSAVLLRGSGSAYNSNRAITEALRSALESRGITPDAIVLAEDTSHEGVSVMLRDREHIDLIIPRGGARLIKNAVENATVPVLETGTGNCHVYIDETADYGMAENIVINSKTQRTGVCNAMETLLVQESWAEKHLEALLRAVAERGVELHGDEQSGKYAAVIPAGEDDWKYEYLRMAMAVKIVSDVREAVEHINRYGTKHTECIVTGSAENGKYFQRAVDAAVVNVNAATRFTDGGEFGFGAEIGISTQKLHARGPMGLKEITSYKYLLTGDGQARG